MSAYSARQIARKNWYRSGLEDTVANYLKEHKVKFLYEKVKIEWEDLEYRTYTPDFVLNNGKLVWNNLIPTNRYVGKFLEGKVFT